MCFLGVKKNSQTFIKMQKHVEYNINETELKQTAQGALE